MRDSSTSHRIVGSVRTFFSSPLPLFVLAHFTHHIITAVAAPLLPLIRTSFELSYTQSGLLLTSFTMAYGLGHLPSGWLTDRISPVIMILVGTVGVAIAGILFGLAPTFPLLIVANGLIGLAASGYHPAASYLISRVTRPEQRGSALGIHVIGGSASYFVAPLLAGGIAMALGWRNTYLALSLPTLLLGIVLVILLRRSAGRSGASVREKRPNTSESHSRRFWAWLISFLVLTTASGALVGSAIGFIPLLLVDSFGLRAEASAGLLALIFSAGFWVAPLAGYLSDRIGKIPLLFGACVMVIPTIYFLPRVPVGPGLYLLLILIGVFIFVRMPVSESFLFSHAPAKRRSTLLGVYFLGASLGGGVFTPLIGRLSDLLSFQRSFAVVALALLVTTVLCGGLLTIFRGAGSEAIDQSPAAQQET